MDLPSLITVVADNGFMVVASAILLLTYIRTEIVRRKREKMEIEREERDNKAREEEQKRRSQEYSQMMDIVLGKIQNTKTHSVEEDEFQEEVNNCIDDVLKKLRASTSASRVMFVRYHNGLYDLVGNSTIKMSATNEDVDVGVSPLLPSFQNQFRGFLTYWCTNIRDKGIFSIMNIETLREVGENAMYEFLNSRGVVSALGHAIYNDNKNVIGFIVIEYLYKTTLPVDKIEACLKDKAIKISALMMLKKGNFGCENPNCRIKE